MARDDNSQLGKPIDDAFLDIPIDPTQEKREGFIPEPPPFQNDQFDKIEVGKGDKTFKVDEQGIWLGAKTFEEAPFRITMNGTLITNDGENDRILIGNNI